MKSTRKFVASFFHKRKNVFCEKKKKENTKNKYGNESKIQRRSAHQISSNATMIVPLSNYDRARVVKARLPSFREINDRVAK